MLHHWHVAVDKGESVRTVFVDFAKAFDHVDHNVLVAKLAALGLRDVIVLWMTAFLQERRQRLKIGDVRLVAAVSWHAAGIIPRPTDVYHLDRRAATGLSE